MANSANREVKLKRPLEEVKGRLQAQIDEGEHIIKYPISNEHDLKLAEEAVRSWRDYTKDLLLILFSTDKMQREFVDIVSSFGMFLTFQQKVAEHFLHLDMRLNTLRSILRRLNLFEEDTGTAVSTLAVEAENINRKNVFVVHGRNELARKAMFEYLRAIGLEPIEWLEAIKLTGKGSPYIGEVLDVAFSHARAIVVLLTGDDLARLGTRFIDKGEKNEQLTQQARPNVIFEAGLAFGRHHDRTVLVQLGELRDISDLAGRHIIKMDNSIGRRQELASRLKSTGCEIQIEDRIDWHNAGDFDGAVVPPDLD